MKFYDLLKASKGLPVRDPLAVLWGKQLSTDWPVTEITGSLPLSFLSKGGVLSNYRVYGTSEGAGVQTENLVTEIIQNASIGSTGKLTTSNLYNASIAPITAGTTYTLLRDYTTASLYYAFFTELPAIGSVSYDGSREDVRQLSVTITAPVTGYVVLLNKNGESTVAEGNTAIPYGYQIPLNVTYPNLFDKNATDTSNGYVANRRIVASTGADYASTDNFISEYIYVIPNTVYTLNGIEVVAGSSVAPPGVCYYDANHVFLSGDTCRRASGKWLFSNYQITTPANAAYIRINVSYDTADTAMLTRTNTAPSAYIPHDITTPIYIGSSKLYEDEYVDYQEQKVYKKKPNLVSGIIDNVYVTRDGVLSTNSALNGAVTPIEKDKVYTVPHATGGNMFCGCFEEYPVLDATTYNSERFTFRSEYYTFTAPVTGYLVSSVSFGVTDPIVYEGEYPQLAPTDPPMPFEAIQTFSGENTLSSTETVGEVSVTGRIRSAE